eukprot:TRINITY_DN22776_c0_g1_i2.p2 TRINITY_DN22776_c0_g1~~TRINITY_DN22776_c0_g1_i2.p2  ORF type:complete len:885 (+),score=197.60 TRINITY_DN22776_c0_g1_i2:76-2655(+)
MPSASGAPQAVRPRLESAIRVMRVPIDLGILSSLPVLSSPPSTLRTSSHRRHGQGERGDTPGTDPEPAAGPAAEEADAAARSSAPAAAAPERRDAQQQVPELALDHSPAAEEGTESPACSLHSCCASPSPHTWGTPQNSPRAEPPAAASPRPAPAESGSSCTTTRGDTDSQRRSAVLTPQAPPPIQTPQCPNLMVTPAGGPPPAPPLAMPGTAPRARPATSPAPAGGAPTTPAPAPALAPAPAVAPAPASTPAAAPPAPAPAAVTSAPKVRSPCTSMSLVPPAPAPCGAATADVSATLKDISSTQLPLPSPPQLWLTPPGNGSSDAGTSRGAPPPDAMTPPTAPAAAPRQGPSSEPSCIDTLFISAGSMIHDRGSLPRAVPPPLVMPSASSSEAGPGVGATCASPFTAVSCLEQTAGDAECTHSTRGPRARGRGGPPHIMIPLPPPETPRSRPAEHAPAPLPDPGPAPRPPDPAQPAGAVTVWRVGPSPHDLRRVPLGPNGGAPYLIPSYCYILDLSPPDAERELHIWLGAASGPAQRRTAERAADVVAGAGGRRCAVYRNCQTREAPALLRGLSACKLQLSVDARAEELRSGGKLLRIHRDHRGALRVVAAPVCRSVLRRDCACVCADGRGAGASPRPSRRRPWVWYGSDADVWVRAAALSEVVRLAAQLCAVAVHEQKSGGELPPWLGGCGCEGGCGVAADAAVGADRPPASPGRPLSAGSPPPRSLAPAAAAAAPKWRRLDPTADAAGAGSPRSPPQLPSPGGEARWQRAPAEDAAYVGDDGECVWVLVGAEAAALWPPSAALTAAAAYLHGAPRLHADAPRAVVPFGTAAPHLRPLLTLCGAVVPLGRRWRLGPA